MKYFNFLLIISILPAFLCISFKSKSTIPAHSYLELKNEFIPDAEVSFESGNVGGLFTVKIFKDKE